MNFGERLGEILEDKDISQKDFAKLLNIAPSTLNGYIKNRRQPDVEMLKKMAETLNISVDYLIGADISAFTIQEMNLIADIRMIKRPQREVIFDLIKTLLKKK